MQSITGEVPTADCGEGVRIPITVDGQRFLRHRQTDSATTLGSKVPVTWEAPFEDKRSQPRWNLRLYGSPFVERSIRSMGLMGWDPFK